MRIARLTKIIITLLVLTFVGQSVASVSLSCMDTMPGCQENMQGSADCMDMDAPELETESSEYCADCACSLGSCSTALLSTLVPVFEATTSTALLIGYRGSPERRLIPSLYRPPISR